MLVRFKWPLYVFITRVCTLLSNSLQFENGSANLNGKGWFSYPMRVCKLRGYPFRSFNLAEPASKHTIRSSLEYVRWKWLPVILNTLFVSTIPPLFCFLFAFVRLLFGDVFYVYGEVLKFQDSFITCNANSTSVLYHKWVKNIEM